MAYRNKTYIAFDGDTDMSYYRMMTAWHANPGFSFEFPNAHDLNTARDSSQEESIKRQLRERLKIGDLFTEMGDTVISASTTFDTDISGGLISANSLQGQLALRVFEGNTAEIDRQLKAQLEHIGGVDRPDAPGKKKEFPIGTVAKVTTPGRNFYFVAMARLNEHGTAKSTVRNIEDALSGLWQFVTDQGEMRTLLIPLMGTGRGRIELPRKKVIERIAQSFADASKEKIFTNRLKIIIQPEDAENFALNLFEVRDYLTRSLHV